MVITFIVGLTVSFATGFLKTFQIKNITSQSYMLAVITSVIMKTLDIAILGIIANAAVSGNTISTAIPVIIGGSIGVITSMLIHESYFKSKQESK